MRKIIASIMTLCLVLLTGCSTTQLEYWNKMKETSKWEATEINQVGEGTIDVMGMPIQIKMDTKGYMNQKTVSGRLMTKVAMTLPEELMAQMPTDKLEFSMDMYFVEGKIYIHRSYFEQIIALSGMQMPEALANLDAEYIGFKENNEMMAQMMKSMEWATNPEEMFKLYEEIGNTLELDIPMTKEGNTYSIKLNKDQLITMCQAIVDNVVMKMDTINEKYKLGLAQEDIKAMQEGYKTSKEQFMSSLGEMAAKLKGQFEVKTTFNKDQMITNMLMDLGIEGTMQMKLNMTQDAMKTSAKKVEMPGKIAELSEADIMKLMETPTPDSVIYIDEVENTLETNEGDLVDIKIIEKDGQKFLPGRVVLDEFMMPIEYDKASKTAYVLMGTEKVKVNEMSKENKGYISLETLQRLGIVVEEIEGAIVLSK